MQRRGRRPSVSLDQIDRDAAEQDAEPPEELLYIGPHHYKAIDCLTERERQDFAELVTEAANLYAAAVLKYRTDKAKPPEPGPLPEPPPDEKELQHKKSRQEKNDAAESKGHEEEAGEKEEKAVAGIDAPDEADPEEQERMKAAFAAAMAVDEDMKS